jgi:phosphate transport system protein
MTSQHIVKSFDDQLNKLDNTIAEMGGLAEHQLAEAMDALVRRDVEKAAAVAAADVRIDKLESMVDQNAVALLALRQPMATDLRVVISALKTSGIIERVGDYAKNVAKRTLVLAELPPVPPGVSITRLGYLAQRMFKDVLDAYSARDVEKAELVRLRDEEVDALYTSIFRELLTYMMEDPRNITPCTHLLFVAKNMERIGDHATNIAENVHYMVRGEIFAAERPKHDESAFAVVTPGDPAGVEGE